MPPAKCGNCAKFISPQEAARCSTCNTLFHRACGFLPLSGPVSTTWNCPDCKNKTMKGKLDPTPGEALGSKESTDSSALNCSILLGDTRILSAELPSILRGFKDELRAEMRLVFQEELRAELLSVREEFRALRADLTQLKGDRDQLKESVEMCSERMNNMNVRIATLEQKLLVPSGAAEEVAQLRRELNDRDQLLLANDLEISNLPETNSENLIHTVKLIATKLGMNIEERDIVSVDRIGGRQINVTSAAGAVDARPRLVVVRLARRDLRDELMRSARVRRGANTGDLDMSGPPRKFYINERLTKLNRQLFRRTREAGQRLGWQYVWTKHGRILARHKPGDKASLIRNEADLLHVFGPDSAKEP